MDKQLPNVSIAPMMGYTNTHFRHLLRLVHPQLELYTEMLTCNQLMHSDHHRLLQVDSKQQPLVLQLAGCEPKHLAHCVALSEDYPYQAINLNIGCPSPRLAAARYGACLYKEPMTVARCVAAMCHTSSRPITVKTRVGVDEHIGYKALYDFVARVADAGCQSFILHARQAWLKGLSPRQNRHLPPLEPELVYRLKQDFSHLEIIINGGIKSLSQAQQHLQHVDGVMFGRLSYQDFFALAAIVQQLLPTSVVLNREQLIASYLSYVCAQFKQQQSLRVLLKPLFACYRNMPEAKLRRRQLQQMMNASDLAALELMIARFLKQPEKL